MNDEYIRSRCGPSSLHLGGRKRKHHPVESESESEAFDRRSSKGLRKAVVASASDKSILRTEASPGDLKRRSRIVVQAAHHSRRYRVCNASRIEMSLELLEMSLRIIVE